MPPTSDDPLLNVRLRLRSGLVFTDRMVGNEPMCLVEDTLRNKYYQVGRSEAAFLKTLDGSLSIGGMRTPEFSGVAKQTTAIEIVKWALAQGLVTFHENDNCTRLQNQAASLRTQRLLSWLNPIYIRIPLFQSAKILGKFNYFGKILFSKTSAVIWACVLGYAAILLCQRMEEVGQKYIGVFASSEWLVLLIVWVLLKIIHEMGHGLACQRFGGQAGLFGISFILFTPLAFIDVTSSWRFSNRWHRIFTAAAGMYFELFIAALAFIAWCWTPDDFAFRSTFYKVFLTAGVTTVLFNANPLMKFDGYYILSDLLGIPNLYLKGSTWFSEFVRRIVFGTVSKSQDLNLAEGIWIRTYGFLSAFWRVLVSVGLIIGASVLLHGAGIAFAILAIVFWYAVPLFRSVQQLRAKNLSELNYRRCSIVVSCLALSAIAMFTVVSAPSSKSAPAVVRYEEEQPLRAPTSAFIVAIHVEDGQHVIEGQRLVTLENRDLEQEIVALAEQLNQSQIRARISLQEKQLAIYQAETESQIQLQKKLSEKQTAAAKLEIRSPFEGIVIGRKLADDLGRYVDVGSTILSLAKTHQPEIVVSVDQTDLASLQSPECDTFRAVFPGQSVLQCSLKHLDTRATTLPAHRALGADVGGPLAVRQAETPTDGEATTELLSPRVNVELKLPTAFRGQLLAGQTGRVVFKAKSQSLGAYLFVRCEEWFDNKIRMALGSTQ